MTEAELSRLAEILMRLTEGTARPSFNYESVLLSALLGVVGGVGTNLVMNWFRGQERREAQLRRARVKADRDLRSCRRRLKSPLLLPIAEDGISPETIPKANAELKERYDRIYRVLRDADDIEYGELFLDAIKEARLAGARSEKRRDYGPELDGVETIIKRLERKYKGPWLELERKFFED